MTQDNSSKSLLIAALVMIILQGANLVGVAINTRDIISQKSLLRFVSKDYVPMWFLEGLQENNDYRTQEIIASIGGDEKKLEAINKKYIAFQKIMISNMASMRGGMTNITRNGIINKKIK